MPKSARSKKRHPLHKRIIRKLYSRGSIYVYLLLAVVIGMGILLASSPTFKKSEAPAPIANSCIDYDPPNTSITITFNNTQYDLIKKDAGIATYKVSEMTQVGSFNNQDLYQMNGANYFGKSGAGTDIIYAKTGVNGSFTNFDIYIKDGVPIPDSLKSSQSIGATGQQQVIIDDSTTFPPSGFNQTDIQNLTQNLDFPAYVYNQNKTTLSSIQGLNGIKKVGNIPFDNKNLQVYFHLGTIYLVDGTDAYEYIGTDTPVDFKTISQNGNSLSLKKFTVKTVNLNPICWYTPECKPALYLYPDKTQKVDVQINPKGYLTYSLPKYDNGWNVIANPNGNIEFKNSTYPYLYYESAIADSEIQVPNKGYVVKYDELDNLYDTLLPKLGLNTKEASDFKAYWNKTLPKANYYFVGIMDLVNINNIEKLTILPKPATTIRVRLYFKALDNFQTVEAPTLPQITRPTNGFLAVEWGGMVKQDPNHPFTCSQ